MKRAYWGLIFVLFIFISFPVSAQKPPFRQELSAGGSFGTALSSVSFYPSIKTNSLLTYNAGMTIRWITQRNVGIQAELNYSQKGWDEFFDDPQYYYTRRINYIDLPFLTHIYIGNRAVRAIINLGPQIGYAFSDNINENVGEELPGPNTYYTTQRTLEIQKKFGWGITGGAGFEVRTKIGIFQLEGRYYYSLGNIFNSRRTDTFGQSSPQQIVIKASYLIPIFTKEK